MEIELLGGRQHRKILRFDRPPPRLRVPVPADLRTFPTDESFNPAFEEETYVLVRRMRTADGPVDTYYVEENLHRAELAYQERHDRRTEMELRARADFGALPDLHRLVSQPYLLACVWRCGDECECEQAEVIGWTYAYTLDGDTAPFPPVPGQFTRTHAYGPGRQRLGMFATVWQGRFHTDGHRGAAADLLLLSEYLAAVGAEDVARQIHWPWRPSP